MPRPEETLEQRLIARVRRFVALFAIVTTALALLAHSPLAPLPGSALQGTPDGLLVWVLLGVVILSYMSRRALAHRSALRDPTTRAQRFFTAYVLSAALAIPAAALGLLEAASPASSEKDLATFFVAAFALLALAFPRGYELDDFDEPLTAYGASDSSQSTDRSPP